MVIILPTIRLITLFSLSKKINQISPKFCALTYAIIAFIIKILSALYKHGYPQYTSSLAIGMGILFIIYFILAYIYFISLYKSKGSFVRKIVYVLGIFIGLIGVI